MQHLAHKYPEDKIAAYFFDDRADIREKVIKTFDQNRQLIPKNIVSFNIVPYTGRLASPIVSLKGGKEKRPSQYPENMPFWIAYCNL